MKLLATPGTDQTIEFSAWPKDRAQRYRDQGYWLDKPLTHFLSELSPERAQAPALICGERTFSYADLNRLSSQLASRLAASGLGKADTALVQLPNIAEFYIAFFALLKVGIAPINALYSHRQHELRAFAQQIKPSLLIASREHAVFRDQSFILELQQSATKPLTTLMLSGHPGDNELQEWVEQIPNEKVHYSPSQADEVAFFQLSGGSTGTPKLIPRTHNDYDYSVRASAEICQLGPTTRFLCALPAAHNYTLSSPGSLGVFNSGGCVVMSPNPEPLRCFDLIERHAVTMVALVPSAVALWLQAAPDHLQQLHTLRLLQVGGASFAESLARKASGYLAQKLQQVFGMAEGLVNYTRLDDPDEWIFGSQGRPISPDDEIKIVDEHGKPVPDGQSGMLATRGPYTVCGYFRSEEHNRLVFDRDGFYYSGDLVQKTPEGNLRVVGRVKDQINRGGEKVAAEEIENLLALHPDVMHAALVAMPDALLGEKSCAFIVSSNSMLKPLSLRRHLMGLGIAEYKLPDRVHMIELMPLTPIGKIDKNALRQILAALPAADKSQTRITS